MFKNPENADTAIQLAKVGTVWGVIGITSWADAASFVAFLLSLAALLEWIWKKVRPIAIERGWIRDKRGKGKRKADDRDAA